jgi:tRNA pseudouridine55 synthase
MSETRPERRDLNGVFLLDKASGYSSNASLQKVRRLFRARKAGHTGSLDPLASGLLPICLGEATKLSSYLLDTDKRYQVRVRLGAETDTADSEGRVTVTRPVPVLSETVIEAVLEGFRGEGMQVPPMYSALKHQGRRLYELARQGIEVDRPARLITIHELRLIGFELTALELEVHCSKGTYIRTLAESIGRMLGTAGHVELLRRTSVGSLDVAAASTIDYLEALAEPGREALLLPMDLLVPHLPAVVLDETMSLLASRGNPVRVADAPEHGWVRLYGHTAAFLGLGEMLGDGRVGSRRILSNPFHAGGTGQVDGPVTPCRDKALD